MVTAALLLVTACGSTGGDLPAGPDLLRKSAEAMRTVKTVAFTLDAKDRPAVPVRHAEGSLTRQGDAKGRLQVELMGLQEFEFVVVGDTVRFKGPTGGFQTMSRAQLTALYDPSAVLTGVPGLLSAAQDARTEAVEQVGGGDAYRVAVTLPQRSLATLVPGVGQSVRGTVWIDRATARVARIDLPLTGGSVLANLRDYDAPVTITPPAS
ncbi:LppX_LprAFG lipoprotein [Microbispora sp. RL4-1S]|uniref:LppX_LprAFG lipoprotein n=1 Tax=Microbispora oryzae TaxID=2806554 RepID=A0A940WB42_9ACTN|nr:LppX_LprAFG lipoprotein [Microbispora oryzae]